MSQPPHTYAGSASSAESVAGYPADAWTATPPTAWPYPTGPSYAPAFVPAPPPARPSPWPAAMVVLAGVLAGLVGAAVLVSVAFMFVADDIGRSMGESFHESMTGDFASGYAVPPPAVEESDPVPPGDLGPDPVLDQYADDCFAGDMEACDNLYYESPPLSDFEEYGGSCGGRVKVYSVMSCTELG